MTNELNEMDLPKTVEELANELKVSERTIRRAAEKLGIDVNDSTVTDIKMPNGGVREVRKLSFTKADADMIAAELSVHHNLKDNTAVVNNTKEMIKGTAQSYLEDLCKDNPYLMMAIEQQKQLKEQKEQLVDMDKRVLALTPPSPKPLNERWYSSNAIYNLYPKARSLFKSPKGLARTLNKYAELKDTSAVRQCTANNGYQYHEFRADFVEDCLN